MEAEQRRGGKQVSASVRVCVSVRACADLCMGNETSFVPTIASPRCAVPEIEKSPKRKRENDDLDRFGRLFRVCRCVMCGHHSQIRVHGII